MQVQVASGMGHRHATIADQLHRLELELPAELPSLHSEPPVPKTPCLGIHETDSSSDGFPDELLRYAGSAIPEASAMQS